MRPLVVVAILVAICTGCPGKSPDRPRPPAVDARLEIARLEAQRGGGLDRLLELAAAGDAGTRDLALRALGRVGGGRALDALIAATADPEPAIATRAAAAIGVLAATSDPPPAVVARTSGTLIATLARPGLEAAVVIEALGRAGDAGALAPLTGRATGKDPELAEAAALALARFSRRELPLDAPARIALVELAGSSAATPGARHAAVWALGREARGEAPKPDRAVTSALVAAIADPDEQTRAAAIAALTRRKEVAAGAAQIEQALRDADWRVAVEAVRALGGDSGTDAGRDAVAAIMVRTWALLAAGGAPAQAHVVIEGLRTIAPSANRPAVRSALVALAGATSAAAVATDRVAPLTRAWVNCLATAGLERADPAAFDGGTRVLGCGTDALASHLRAGLLGELVAAGIGTPTQRRDTLVVLLGAADPRERGAALAVLPDAWAALGPADQDALIPAVVRALASDAVVEAGSAGDAIGALLDDKHQVSAPARASLSAALIERATRERDPELAAGLIVALGAAKLADGKPACEAAIGLASPVIRAAGRDCLAALAGESTDHTTALDEPAAAALPDADPAALLGHRVTWTVETSRGTVVIALAPELAPWHVASIVALTRRGFYDGLVFHRVVPDFVVQGGDPTGTGWGGPGYVLPAEPGSSLDGDAYRTGTIGIADAGKDSGGSQWFAMHSRAPHLDGRYTRIGAVTSGQEIVDAAQVGDRVLKATVTVE